MGKSGEYNIENLKRAETRRQSVLDFLFEHPDSSFDVIADALSQYKRDTIRGTIINMRKANELGSNGDKGDQTYFALRRVTKSAEQIRRDKLRSTLVSSLASRAREKAMGKKRIRKPNDPAVKEQLEIEKRLAHSNVAPGHYRHDPDKLNNHPSGGQGAVRRSVYVQVGGTYESY